MISRSRFLAIAQEGLANPRTSPYAVRFLHGEHIWAYPFRSSGGGIPAVAVQFAVENRYDQRARRVVTLSRSELGYAVWCGDRFTQGDISAEQAQSLIAEAVLQLPSENAAHAVADMERTWGAYPHSAACHFWAAWRSHQGVCKHVAAALQFVDAGHHEGLDGLLDDLDAAYHQLMSPTHKAENPSPSREQARGEVLLQVASVMAPYGGLTSAQYADLCDLLDVLEA